MHCSPEGRSFAWFGALLNCMQNINLNHTFFSSRICKLDVKLNQTWLALGVPTKKESALFRDTYPACTGCKILLCKRKLEDDGLYQTCRIIMFVCRCLNEIRLSFVKSTVSLTCTKVQDIELQWLISNLLEKISPMLQVLICQGPFRSLVWHACSILFTFLQASSLNLN